MGAAHVMVTIRNLADPERHWTGRFLVDTGAFDSLVPAQTSGSYRPRAARRGELQPPRDFAALVNLQESAPFYGADSWVSAAGSGAASARASWTIRSISPARVNACFSAASVLRQRK